LGYHDSPLKKGDNVKQNNKNTDNLINSGKTTARIAGFLYFMLILCGTYLKYVPSKLIKWDNPSVTVSNIIASETLFRLGILAGLIGHTLFLLLPIVLYKLLNRVNKTHAILIVTFGMVSVPIEFANMNN
jgi:nitrate reductase gamma subunit